MPKKNFFTGNATGILGIIILISLIFSVRQLEVIGPITTELDQKLKEYSSEVYGISFKYPDNYSMTEMDVPIETNTKRHVINLVRKEDLPVPVGGEGPTAITISFYQNDIKNETTEQWIRNSKDSNFNLSDGKISSTILGDKPASSYRWSGLYEGTTVVTARKKWIYAFSVTYLEMGAEVVQDFVKVKESVKISQ